MRVIVVIVMMLAALVNPVAALVSPINTAEDNVKFIIADVSPTIVTPGYNGPLNVTIRNVGFTSAFRINGEIDTTTNIPINFLGEIKKYVETFQECTEAVLCNHINTGDTTTLTYEISVSENATADGYTIPLIITWKEIEEKSTTLTFGVEIKGSPDLIISGVTTSPSIVYPDTEFSLPISIENIGSESAKSVSLTLTLDEGFSGDLNAPLGTITKDSTSTATFNLKASESISFGHHNIQAELGYTNTKGEEFSKTVPIDVFIQDRGDVKLSISGVNSTPSKVYPNTDFTLTLTLENTGSQDARSTKIVLTLPDEFSGEDVAFLGTIDEDRSSSATFDLKATKTSLYGKYTVNAEISYTDELGRKTDVVEAFNLFILERGDIILEISGKSTSPPKLNPGQEFTLSLQLENIGDQDAKSVKIELAPGDSINGEFVSFVGEIERDDVSTGVFDLSVSPTATGGTTTVTANVVYLDERGIENSVIKVFDIFVEEQSNNSSMRNIAVVIAVVLLLVYLWRRRKSELAEA